jgi:hypothetical protein
MAEGLHGAVCPYTANATTKEVLTDHRFGGCADRRLTGFCGCAHDDQGALFLLDGLTTGCRAMKNEQTINRVAVTIMVAFALAGFIALTVLLLT